MKIKKLLKNDLRNGLRKGLFNQQQNIESDRTIIKREGVRKSCNDISSLIGKELEELKEYYKNEDKILLYDSFNLSKISKECERRGIGYIEYNKQYNIYCLLIDK